MLILYTFRLLKSQYTTLAEVVYSAVFARMAVAVTEPGATTFVVLVSNDMVAVFANVCGTVLQ